MQTIYKIKAENDAKPRQKKENLGNPKTQQKSKYPADESAEPTAEPEVRDIREDKEIDPARLTKLEKIGSGGFKE